MQKHITFAPPTKKNKKTIPWKLLQYFFNKYIWWEVPKLFSKPKKQSGKYGVSHICPCILQVSKCSTSRKFPPMHSLFSNFFLKSISFWNVHKSLNIEVIMQQNASAPEINICWCYKRPIVINYNGRIYKTCEIMKINMKKGNNLFFNKWNALIKSEQNMITIQNISTTFSFVSLGDKRFVSSSIEQHFYSFV